MEQVNKLYRTKFYTVNNDYNVDSVYYGKDKTEVIVGANKDRVNKDCKYCKADTMFVTISGNYKTTVLDYPINRKPTVITYKKKVYACKKCNKHWHYKASIHHSRVDSVTRRLYDWVIYWLEQGAKQVDLMRISGIKRNQMIKIIKDYQEHQQETVDKVVK